MVMVTLRFEFAMGSDIRRSEADRKWPEMKDQSMTQEKPPPGLPAVTNGMESVQQVGRGYRRDETSSPRTPAGWGGKAEASPPWSHRRWNSQPADVAKTPVPLTGAIREPPRENRLLKKLEGDGRRRTKTWPAGHQRRDPEELPSLSSSRQDENTSASWPGEVITRTTGDRNDRVVSWQALCHSDGCSRRRWPKGSKVPQKPSLYNICPTCHWSRMVETAGKAAASSNDGMYGAKKQALPQAVNVPLATNGWIPNRRLGMSASEEDGIQPNSPEQRRQPLDESAVAFPVIEEESQSWKLAYDWKRGRKQKQHAKTPPVNGQYKERWMRLMFMGKRELDFGPMSFVTSDGNRITFDNVWKFEKESDFWNIFAFSYPDTKPTSLQPASLLSNARTKPSGQKRSAFVSRFGKRGLPPNSNIPLQKRSFVIRLGKRDGSRKFSQPAWKWKRYSWRFVSRFGKRCLIRDKDDFTSPLGKRNNREDNDKFTSRFGKRGLNGDKYDFTTRFGKRDNHGDFDRFASRFGKRNADDFTRRFAVHNNGVNEDKFKSQIGKRSNSWDKRDFTSRFGKRGNLFSSRFGKRRDISWGEEDSSNRFQKQNNHIGVGDLASSRLEKRSSNWDEHDFTSRFWKRDDGKNTDYFSSRFGKRSDGGIGDDSSTRFGGGGSNRDNRSFMRFGKGNNFHQISSIHHHSVPHPTKPESQVSPMTTSDPTTLSQVIRISRRSIGRKPPRGRLILLGRGGEDNQPVHFPPRKLVSPACLNSENSSSCDVPTAHRERRSITPLNNDNTVQTPDGKSMLPVLISPEGIHKGLKPSWVATTHDGQAYGKRRTKRGIFGLKSKDMRPVIRLGKRRPVIRLGKRRPIIPLGKRRSVIRLGKRRPTILYPSDGKGSLGAQKRGLYGNVLRLGKRAQAHEAMAIPDANIVAHVHAPPLNNSGQNQRIRGGRWAMTLPTHGRRLKQIPSGDHAAPSSYKRAYSPRRIISAGNTDQIKLSAIEGDIPRNGRPRGGIRQSENQERIEGHWSPPGSKGTIRVRQSNAATSEPAQPSPGLRNNSKAGEAIEKRTNVKSGKSIADDDLYLIQKFEDSVKARRSPETYSKATWDGGTAD
ncbi:PREDICTED: uncharacterized protein LOC109464054 [Branchiostoma belcheri]|uniref:Uncharacterized protein LOC109464054 n=1 Tax=Branchiostoma belcheri TaxID=7741 RepID=A0A6P4YHR1_BRABE|nr:PREDICTED: uncharacterized protein LOC109464054 [Branchiostoma belcheri]